MAQLLTDAINGVLHRTLITAKEARDLTGGSARKIHPPHAALVRGEDRFDMAVECQIIFFFYQGLRRIGRFVGFIRFGKAYR